MSDVSLASIAAQQVPSATGSGQPIGGKLLAVGDVSGTVSLLDASPGLTVPLQDERGAMAALLERESRREETLEKRAQAVARAMRSNSVSGAAGGAAMLAAASAVAQTPAGNNGAQSPWMSRTPVPLGSGGGANPLGASTATLGAGSSTPGATTTAASTGGRDRSGSFVIGGLASPAAAAAGGAGRGRQGSISGPAGQTGAAGVGSGVGGGSPLMWDEHQPEIAAAVKQAEEAFFASLGIQK